MNTETTTLATESNTDLDTTIKPMVQLISTAELMNRFCEAETKPEGTIGTDHHLADLDLINHRAQMVFFIPSKSFAGIDIEIRLCLEDERIFSLSAYSHDGETTEDLLSTEDKTEVLHAYFNTVRLLTEFA